VKLRRVFIALPGLIACHLFGAEPPLPAHERTAMLAQFAAEVSALDKAIDENPRDPANFSRRGDRFLFLGNFAAAVADFERMIVLDPAQDAPHWRLGIAYHFTHQFAKSSKQFEKYHAYDGVDRENGIWKFLADVKVIGLEPARRAMLVYHRFDREPFPALYEMFAGRKTTTEFLAELERRGLTGNQRVMFFARYYAGLNEDLAGRRDSAITLLREAVANPWGRTAEGGPAYMWQVARLHYEVMSAKTDSR
jgi:lipoprotein NlpI